MLRITRETQVNQAVNTFGSVSLDFQIIAHAGVRAKQRGAKINPISLVLIYGDRERAAHRGRTIRGLSGTVAEELISEGFRPADVHQAQTIELVLSNGSIVITILRVPAPCRSALLADRGSPRNRIMKARRHRLDWEL